MTFGERLGRLQYLRGKGSVTLEILRPWVLPALGGGAALKYLGLSTPWALGVMVGLGVVMEAGAVVLGWIEYRSGATRAHYKLAGETDPFRSEQLALLREIRDRLQSSPSNGSAPFGRLPTSVTASPIDPRARSL